MTEAQHSRPSPLLRGLEALCRLPSAVPPANVLQRMPYMAWTYDARGALDYVNAAWTTYAGSAPTLRRGHRAMWRDLVAADEFGPFADALDVAMGKRASFRADARLRQGGNAGEYRLHTIDVVPNYGANGNVIEWVGTAVDVENTERATTTLVERDVQLQRERARSTSFQRAILPPHLPIIPGLTFDAIYEPGLSDMNVGGDWYDAVRLLDGRVLLSIGDVSGSGLNAAVVMGVVRQIMRGIAQLHAEPAVMLDACDRALRLEYPDTIVTAWVGVLDLVAKTLTFASAGHPPPLLLNTNGTVKDLDHLTLPIGLRQGHQGHASTVPISDGSAIWLYTDGLIEATHDILEGTRLLEKTALQLSTEHVADCAATIRRLVIPDGSPDDVAILVVKVATEESERYLARSSFDATDGDAATAARRSFAASLSPQQFSKVDVANAEVVFGELCGNVACHAPGVVDIVVDGSGPQTVLHVLDRGAGFRHLSRLPGDPNSESGRGLYIIAAMTTEFIVSQRPDGGSHARAVLVGRYPISLLRDQTLPAVTDQVAERT